MSSLKRKLSQLGRNEPEQSSDTMVCDWLDRVPPKVEAVESFSVSISMHEAGSPAPRGACALTLPATAKDSPVIEAVSEDQILKILDYMRENQSRIIKETLETLYPSLLAPNEQDQGSKMQTDRNRSIEATEPDHDNKDVKSTLEGGINVAPRNDNGSNEPVCESLVQPKDKEYREILAYSFVTIDPTGKSIPKTVKKYVDEILERNTPPPLTAESIDFIQEVFHEVGDYTAFSYELFSTQLFPSKADYLGRIDACGGLPFATKPLPRSGMFNMPPMALPVSDLQYGYHEDLFNEAQRAVLDTHQLSAHTRPTTGTILPRFLVHFVAPAPEGTRWAAINRAAAAGSHCVDSMTTLFEHIHQKTGDYAELDPKDSIAFSCIVDSESLALWVHFRKCCSYHSAPVDGYWMHKPEDLQRFHRHARNIIDYMLEDHLDIVKLILDYLHPHLDELNVPDGHKYDPRDYRPRIRSPERSISERQVDSDEENNPQGADNPSAEQTAQASSNDQSPSEHDILTEVASPSEHNVLTDAASDTSYTVVGWKPSTQGEQSDEEEPFGIDKANEEVMKDGDLQEDLLDQDEVKEEDGIYDDDDIFDDDVKEEELIEDVLGVDGDELKEEELDEDMQGVEDLNKVIDEVLAYADSFEDDMDTDMDELL